MLFDLRSFGVYFVTLISSVGCVGMPMAARSFSGGRNGTARIDRLLRHHVWRPRPIQSAAQWPLSPQRPSVWFPPPICWLLLPEGRPAATARERGRPAAGPPGRRCCRRGGAASRPAHGLWFLADSCQALTPAPSAGTLHWSEGTPRNAETCCELLRSALDHAHHHRQAQPYFRRGLARSAIHPTCNWTAHTH